VNIRTGLKAQVKAVLAKHCLQPPVNDLWVGQRGPTFLDEVALPDAYVIRIESLRDLVAMVDREIAMLNRLIHTRLKNDRGYQAIQQLDGVGPVIAAVFCAEIGDVGRFPGPKALSSWAGLTPRHRESDLKAWRGKATKQGSRLLRWAAVEAVSKMRGGPKLRIDYHRIADRRGRNIARVAVARKLLTLVYYGLRDGEIRSLARAAVA